MYTGVLLFCLWTLSTFPTFDTKMPLIVQAFSIPQNFCHSSSKTISDNYLNGNHAAIKPLSTSFQQHQLECQRPFSSYCRRRVTIYSSSSSSSRSFLMMRSDSYVDKDGWGDDIVDNSSKKSVDSASSSSSDAKEKDIDPLSKQTWNTFREEFINYGSQAGSPAETIVDDPWGNKTDGIDLTAARQKNSPSATSENITSNNSNNPPKKAEEEFSSPTNQIKTGIEKKEKSTGSTIPTEKIKDTEQDTSSSKNTNVQSTTTAIQKEKNNDTEQDTSSSKNKKLRNKNVQSTPSGIRTDSDGTKSSIGGNVFNFDVLSKVFLLATPTLALLGARSALTKDKERREEVQKEYVEAQALFESKLEKLEKVTKNDSGALQASGFFIASTVGLVFIVMQFILKTGSELPPISSTASTIDTTTTSTLISPDRGGNKIKTDVGLPPISKIDTATLESPNGGDKKIKTDVELPPISKIDTATLESPNGGDKKIKTDVELPPISSTASRTDTATTSTLISPNGGGNKMAEEEKVNKVTTAGKESAPLLLEKEELEKMGGNKMVEEKVIKPSTAVDEAVSLILKMEELEKFSEAEKGAVSLPKKTNWLQKEAEEETKRIRAERAAVKEKAEALKTVLEKAAENKEARAATAFSSQE